LKERHGQNEQEKSVYQNKKETKTFFSFVISKAPLLYFTTSIDQTFVDRALRRREEMAVVETQASDLSLSDVNINWDR
jgi:hypothetical protein